MESGSWVPPGTPTPGQPLPQPSEDPQPSSSSHSRELPPPQGFNYRTVHGRQQKSLLYKQIGGQPPGVTFTMERMKKPQPGEPKTFYMRCSTRSSKSRCKARATICDGQLVPLEGETHTCFKDRTKAKEVELKVLQARKGVHNGALGTNDTPLVIRITFIEFYYGDWWKLTKFVLRALASHAGSARRNRFQRTKYHFSQVRELFFGSKVTKSLKLRNRRNSAIQTPNRAMMNW